MNNKGVEYILNHHKMEASRVSNRIFKFPYRLNLKLENIIFDTAFSFFDFLPHMSDQDATSIFTDSVWVKSIRGINFNKRQVSKMQTDVAIWDEAHKMSKLGSKVNQLLDITYKLSNICLVLIDDMQMTIKSGATIEDYKHYANKNSITVWEHSLNESFRNGFDISYPNWVKNWIFRNDSHDTESSQEFFVNNNYQVSIYEGLWGDGARLISFWFLYPHWDVDKKISIGNRKFSWNINQTWLRRENIGRVSGKITKSIKANSKISFTLSEKWVKWLMQLYVFVTFPFK